MKYINTSDENSFHFGRNIDQILWDYPEYEFYQDVEGGYALFKNQAELDTFNNQN